VVHVVALSKVLTAQEVAQIGELIPPEPQGFDWRTFLFWPGRSKRRGV